MIDFKSLFSKEQKKSKIQVDIHSHLIPNIDDGAKDIQKSLHLISELKKLGYTKLITTPHISSKYKNKSDTIKYSFKCLQKTLESNDIDIKMEVAAEYYVDEKFLELLNKKDILSFGDDYLLFEFSYIYKPVNILEIVYEIQEAGYIPVLAHPERYMFFHHDKSFYEKLHNQGVLFQINLNSLDGYYSKAVKNIAKSLVKGGLVDFLGSDTHHHRHISALKKVINSKYYSTIFEKNAIINNNLL